MIEEPYGWNKATCNICGTTRKHKLYISIRIATGDTSQFPYTQTDLCYKCWLEHGIRSAKEHNKFIREVSHDKRNL